MLVPAMVLSAQEEPGLHALEQRLRKFVNNPRIQSGLLERSADWNTLCSAMDVVGDTEVALGSYLAHREDYEESFLYIVAYGVLQVLQSQQDAVFAILRIFGLEKPHSDPLVRIRKIRARSIGHPTLEKEGGQALSGFITRVSLTRSGFQLMIAYDKDHKHDFIPVDLPELIKTQRAELCKALRPVLDLLTRDEKMHREKHKSTKLAQLLHPTTSYYVQKVFEGILSPDSELGIAHVQMLQEELGAFRKELETRGAQFEDLVRYDIAKVEHALGRLSGFFIDGGPIDPDDAYVFASFIGGEFDRLAKIAEQIDEDYAKEVPEG